MAYITTNEINRSACGGAAEFIDRTEREFDALLERLLAERLLKRGCDIVLLAGPSSSGKTTTAAMLARKIKKSGRNAYVLSLDDFYCNVTEIPMTESGVKDFENVNSLDLDLIHKTFDTLIKNRKAYIPKFDFQTGTRNDKTKLVTLDNEDVIIVEGIHALNPVITKGINEKHILKVYISVSSRVLDDSENVVFGKRDLRFIRRMVRDNRYRNTSVEKTFMQWQEVLRGEDSYIFPFEGNADCRVDSFHPYEPCVFKNEAVELLEGIERESTFYASSRRLITAFSAFETINGENIPENSLLREFI